MVRSSSVVANKQPDGVLIFDPKRHIWREGAEHLHKSIIVIEYNAVQCSILFTDSGIFPPLVLLEADLTTVLYRERSEAKKVLFYGHQTCPEMLISGLPTCPRHNFWV